MWPTTLSKFQEKVFTFRLYKEQFLRGKSKRGSSVIKRKRKGKTLTESNLLALVSSLCIPRVDGITTSLRESSPLRYFLPSGFNIITNLPPPIY